MSWCNSNRRGLLYLEDGTLIEGCGFGAETSAAGEVVFTTAMNGYPESLTDPSYKGQILVITHPLVGNYGVPKPRIEQGIIRNFESESIQVNGLVVAEDTEGGKWNAEVTLHEWLRRNGVPGLSGVDTRMIVKKIREGGTMAGLISSIETSMDEIRTSMNKFKYEEINFTQFTSVKNVVFHPNSGPTVVVVDCGIKHGILEQLYFKGFTLVRVPCNFGPNRIMDYSPAGIVISNGPGNPNLLQDNIRTFRELTYYKIPILGICLGHQIASIAMGGNITKMKFGHRGINKPVVDLRTGKCYITTHNHGYALLKSDVPRDFDIWFYDPDDQIVEGLVHKRLPIITTQFHPEARPGPNDIVWVFEKFKRMISDGKY
jgi:carbamoyl-phosphate synthase small subunit